MARSPASVGRSGSGRPSACTVGAMTDEEAVLEELMVQFGEASGHVRACRRLLL